MSCLNCIVVLTCLVCLCKSHTRYIDFEVVGSAPASMSKERVACAETYAHNRYIAARVDDVTGMCEGLQWDWGSDPEYESGYTYLRKMETVETYDPVRSTNAFNWIIPGSLGVGAWVESTFIMPSGDWTGFKIEMLDSTDFNHNVYGGESEVVMVHIWTDKAQDKLVFKAWWYGWTNKKTISPLPFADGSTNRIKFVPLVSDMQILFNDVEVVRYTHPTDPSTSKLLKFAGYSGTVLHIHNITFVGV